MLKTGQRGFTLIEMAMVLGIIALVISGIVVGQNLIRNSQLRSVASETARFTQAISNFRDKYLALPGDFASATALWGTPAAGCPSGPTNGSLIFTETCDGNGDGRITTQAADATANEYEQFRVWQHLVNAGMIEGSYNGIAGANDPMQAIIGSNALNFFTTLLANVPSSKLPGAGYSIISLLSSEIGSNTVVNHYFPGINYMHMLQFGAPCTAKSTLCPIITTAEALSIDSKLDDGLPTSGKIMGPQKQSPYSPNCTSANTVLTTTVYDQAQTGKNCSLLFLLGF